MKRFFDHQAPGMGKTDFAVNLSKQTLSSHPIYDKLMKNLKLK